VRTAEQRFKKRCHAEGGPWAHAGGVVRGTGALRPLRRGMLGAVCLLLLAAAGGQALAQEGLFPIDRYEYIYMEGQPTRPGLSIFRDIFRENTIVLTLMTVISITTLRINVRLQQSRKALQRANQLAEDAQAIARIGSWELDRATGAISCSREMMRLLGYELDEVRPELEFFQRHVHPDEVERVTAAIEEAGAESRTFDLQFRIIRRDGAVRFMQFQGKPVSRDTHHRPADYVGSCQDITETKRYENEIKETNQKLQAALEELQNKEAQIIRQERLRALGEMAGGVAHDFNNALQPILLAAGMLNRRRMEISDDPKVHEYLQIILMAAREASGTVKRLVRFFRPGRDHTKSLVDVAPLIKEVITVAQPKWREEAHSRGVEIVIQTDLQEPCLTRGYADELRELLVNLLFNAIDAIEQKGFIRFETRNEGNRIMLRVTDSGIGMSPETSARCLEPFFTTKAQRGTGLGLSVVYGVVQRHKGTIDLKTEEGEGTTFTIHLPRARRTAAERDDSAEAQDEDPARRRPLRLLVVEDDAKTRQLLEEELRAEGMEVRTAANGDAGWQAFQADAYDAVITGHAMPGLSGEQLVSRIKARRPETFVIMVTGFGKLLESDLPQKKMDVLLSKPAQVSDIVLALKRAGRGVRDHGEPA